MTDSGEYVPVTEGERRAARAGVRVGKVGYPVTDCPYAPAVRSPAAVAWRRGWTLGNAAFRKATEADDV